MTQMLDCGRKTKSSFNNVQLKSTQKKQQAMKPEKGGTENKSSDSRHKHRTEGEREQHTDFNIPGKKD